MSEGKFSAFIIDDEPAASAALHELLKAHDSVMVNGVFNSPEKAVQAIISNCPDILFLDVQMPGMDGFSVLKEVKARHLSPSVVFFTAFDRYAIDAIKNAAFDYLLKPVKKEELAETINRLEKSSGKSIDMKMKKLLDFLEHKNKVKLESTGGFALVDPEKILYCLADWNYTEIYLTEGQKEVVTQNIGKVHQILPAGSFFRINRSTLVNMRYLSRINRLLRKCTIKCNEKEYSFSIPRSRIRELEDFIQR